MNNQVEATGLHDMADILFHRQIHSKLKFKLLHALGSQNTGQVETKELLAVFNRINVASFEQFHMQTGTSSEPYTPPKSARLPLTSYYIYYEIVQIVPKKIKLYTTTYNKYSQTNTSLSHHQTGPNRKPHHGR